MTLKVDWKFWLLTAYKTANVSDCVKLQSVDSSVTKYDVVTISKAPKKYEYAVTDRFAGYFFNIGA
jgi:hypothetical protein